MWPSSRRGGCVIVKVRALMTSPAPSDTGGTVRVGVRFERPPAAKQAVLDRYVFGLMKKRARAKRPLGQSPTGAERRLAPRVEIGPAEMLALTLLPTRPLGALSRLQGKADPPGTPVQMLDLSTTGCSFLCADSAAVKRGGQVRLQLKSDEMDLELLGKVIHLQPAGP